jgi:hypothetical protein
LWVLEWPACAAFGYIWPGLRCIDVIDDMSYCVEGINWLGDIPPKVRTMHWIIYPDYNINITDVDLLGAHSRECRPFTMFETKVHHPCTWLVVDDREELLDKVVEVEPTESTIRQSNVHFDGVHKNWIGFLNKLWWDTEEKAAERTSDSTYNHRRYRASPDLPIFPGTPWLGKA